MKKLLFVPIAFALFSMSACNKLKDYWDDYDGADHPRSYKITRWDVGEVSATFTYDNHNNPLRVVFTSTSTGLTNWWFLYDHQNRLKETYEHYNDDTVAFHQHTVYVYDNNNKIIRDTIHFYNPDPASRFYVITDYNYDTKGRVVHTTLRNGAAAVAEADYAYDAGNNLVRPGFTYDNKANVNLTSPVWQFLNRDYSNNNPFPAVSYNKAKLPKQFNYPLPVEQAYQAVFLKRPFSESTFAYQKK